jgi:tetratricopeptide (TPR) repeat protein
LQFSHDLVFETVLENIPESTKVVLHGSVLDTLENAGVAAAILASHAIGAQRLEATVRYSLKAGFEAFELRALPEAITHLEVVRNLILEPPSGFDLQTALSDQERFQVYFTLYNSYDSAGTDQRLLERQVVAEMDAFGDETQDESVKAEIQFVLAKDYYYQTWGGGDYPVLLQTRLEQARKKSDLKSQIDILEQLSFYEWDHDHPAASKMCHIEQISIARRLGDPVLLSAAISSVACQNTLLDLWDESEEGYDQVTKFNRQDRHFVINIGVYHGLNLLCLGRTSEAIAIWHENMDLLQSFDLMRGLMTLMWLTSGLLEMGDYGGALECVSEYDRKATPVYTRHYGQERRFSNYSWVLLQLGQLQAARELLNEAKMVKKGWNQEKVPHIAEYFCALFALQADWQAASNHALEAIKRREMMPHDKYRLPIFRPTWLETEALLRGGHNDLARQEVRRLFELARHYKRMQIPYFRALAVLEAWDKQLELAIKSLNEALSLSLELGLPSEIWQINAKLAEVYEKSGDLENAQKARDAALNVIQTLANTIPDLEIRNTFLEFATGRLIPVSIQ